MSKISTPLGIAIIIVIVLIAGGVLAYQYWWLPKQEIKLPEESPSIKVLSPNGGETWNFGQPQTITWSSQNISQNIGVYIATSDGVGLCYLGMVDTKVNSFTFTPKLLPQGCTGIAGQYRVALYAGDPHGAFQAKDTSDAPFSIK